VVQSSSVAVGVNPVDQASRRAFVTDQSFRELAAYAPGATIRLNAFNLGAATGLTLALTDADAKAWSLTVTATSTHAVDVQIPAGVGLGGAVISARAGSASWFGTLFLDSQDNLAVLNQPTYLVSPSTTVVPADPTTVS